jgi:amino acid adenylation domain-containing protein/non-ribosomal peptide synthase protein (TIGR01720 family)
MNRNPRAEQAFIAGEYSRERKYWLNKLSGDIEKSFFPEDFDKTSLSPMDKSDPDDSFCVVHFQFPPGLFSKVTRAMNGSDSRLQMILTAGLVQLIHKYTGREDIIIGTPITKQEIDAEFVNTALALRNAVSPGMNFKELLFQVRDTIIEAEKNQNYPIDTLPFELNIPTAEDGGFPLFDIALLLENVQDRRYLRGFRLNMVFSFRRTDDFLEGTIEYDTTRYHENTAARIAGLYTRMLQASIDDPAAPLGGFSLLSPEEEKVLLIDYNDTAADFPRGMTLHGIFSERAGKSPDADALIETETMRCVSYRELDEKSGLLAARLVSMGVRTGDVIPVMGQRKIEVITGILSILKAGGAYLPIDATSPPERIEFLIRDSCARILLTQEHLIEKYEDLFKILPAGNVISLDREHNDAVTGEGVGEASGPGDPAYVIYTSGTTGRPKGVVIRHCSAVNYITWAARSYVNEETARFPLYSSISFDMTVTSIFTPLLTGGTVVLYSGDHGRFSIETLIDEDRVDIVKLTPSHLQLLRGKEFSNGPSRRIKRFILGGEDLDTRSAREVYRLFDGKVEMYNEYGPTEATVGCMIHRFHPFHDTRSSVPIGSPAANIRIYLLDKNLAPVLMGVPGELYIGGEGIAAGYLNRPELTAEKFIPSPFIPGDRLYRTGDLARWSSPGSIEFAGRIDQQVKIRGFRVEPGEIESRLLKHPAIGSALVVSGIDSDGDRYLCAYIVPRTHNAFDGLHPLSRVLRDYLSESLPEYMIPAFFVPLEKIPLTLNGKVDMKALPAPKAETSDVYIAPRNPTEGKMADIWADLLGLDRATLGIGANFFELGGHSLKATVLATRIQKEFGMKVSLTDIFRHPTLREISDFVAGASLDLFNAVEPTEKREYYAASSVQRRLYVLQQLNKGTVYNIPTAAVLRGEFRKDKLENTFGALIRRHESLRTSFMTYNDEIVQVIHPKVSFRVDCFESGDTRKRESEKLINAFIRPFDLDNAPLFRVRVIKISADEHVLFVDMHHIVSDGGSVEILIREFMALYAGQALPDLPLQYKDFSQWQDRESVRASIREQESYWKKLFEEAPPVLNLPLDRKRPAVQSFEGDSAGFEITGAETRAIKALALENGATPFMILLAAFGVMLAKLSGSKDIVVGVPVAGRMHADLQNVIGMFVNTLAVRCYPQGNKSFHRFLSEVKNATIEASDNQDYHFEELAAAVVKDRDVGRNPLFDVMFMLDSTERQPVEIPGLTLEPYPFENKIAKFDLSLLGIETDETIRFDFEYCTRLFTMETVQRFILYFRTVLNSLLENPGRKISAVEIIPEEEKDRLLDLFNRTDAEYPAGKTVVHLFREQVEKTPQKTAVVFQGNQWTYEQLNDEAGRWASLLIQQGIAHQRPVILAANRSAHVPAIVLGIAIAGGTYVPVDPQFPEQRIRFILNDSKAGVIMTQSEYISLFPPEIPLIRIDSENPTSGTTASVPSFPGPGQIAYIIYTSGTTGTPRGVIVQHRSLVNYLTWANRVYVKGRDLSFPLYTALTFDLTVTSLFLPLITGNTLIIYPDDPGRLPIENVIEDDKTAVVKVTPSHLKILKNSGKKPRNIRCFIVGGEQLETSLAADIHRLFDGNIEIYNEYGPTETTVGCMIYQYNPENDTRESVPIGIPAANTKIYLLDSYLEPVPTGVAAEIYISGHGVARGYLNNPDLTAEKFNRSYISNRSDESCRAYRSGDLGRMLPSGNIEFIGRTDHQVKIRGYRIEPGEIETCLLGHPEIQETVVLTHKNPKGDHFLCAYYVSPAALDPSSLRDFASNRLPVYMVPSYFIHLPSLPLTPNGKLDCGALPHPETAPAREILPPTNKIEETIIQTWSEVLGIEKDRIGIDTDFFQFGGDSINAIQVSARLLKAGLKLEIRDLFRYPRIKDLAGHVVKMTREIPQETVVGETPLTPIQEAFFRDYDEGISHYNQSVMLYREAGINRETVEKAFAAVVTHHDALRIVFEPKGETRIQKNRDLSEGKLFHLEEFDLSNQTHREDADLAGEIETVSSRIQAGMDLAHGPLVRLGLFHTSKGSHLLIAVHHLVVDTISLSIIVEDFIAGYNAVEKGDTPVFQDKTDSYKRWAEKLREYAVSPAALKQVDYWQSIESVEIKPLSTVDVPRLKMNSRTVSMDLGKEETSALLKDVHRAYNTEINDILLTALGTAVNQWAGVPHVSLHLEGHGREAIISDIEISRTVGWFTSRFPVLLDMSGPHETGARVKAVKETLRRIPDKGIGYGILRYLTPSDKMRGKTFKGEPSISFNYLGHYGRESGTIDRFTFQMSPVNSGDSISPRLKGKYSLDITGATGENGLNMFFEYNTGEFEENAVRELAALFKTALEEIIRHCIGKEYTEMTPSDFSASGVDREDLEAVLEDFED